MLGRLVGLAQLGQLGLHLPAQRAALVVGQRDVEANLRLGQVVGNVQQHVKRQLVACHGIGRSIVQTLAGQQVGGRGHHLIDGRQVEVGVVRVAGPRQAGAGPQREFARG